MQYLVSVIFDNPGLATPTEMEAIDVFNDSLVAEGHWVFAAGLGSPDTATVIDNRNGAAVLTDGPFVESKEFLAGFWISRPPIWTWHSSSPPKVEGLQSEGRGAAVLAARPWRPGDERRHPR